MDETLAAGARVAAYEVIDRLGAGGMGEVYRARDTRLGRTVALKILRAGSDPELLHRLDREARAASALNHPNIVHIYDVGVAAGEAGAHYVVMEHVLGETLRRRLAKGALAIDELLDLGAQLTDGLANAHRAGIIHRDLKPENLMVTPGGALKILDFGLVKLVTAPLGEIDARETLSHHATRAGMLLGTLEYMSPEQASGRPVDHRTDQFSVGLLLFEMATGRPVFRRDTPTQVLAAVIEREAEPLSRLRPDVPPALEALVARCLRKDPADRFAKTDELASELAVLAGRSRSGSSFVEARASVVPPAVSAVVVPPLPRLPLPIPALPALPSVYHVQADNKVRTYKEEKLVKVIRSGHLSGLEMVRREGEDHWQPLFESQIYKREVPTVGDPRDAARRRLVRGLTGHFTGFFITAVVMFAIQHQFPFWLWIWGAVLAVQVLGAVPEALVLLKRRPGEALPAPAGAALPAPEATGAAGGGERTLRHRAGGRPGATAHRGAREQGRLEPAG